MDFSPLAEPVPTVCEVCEVCDPWMTGGTDIPKVEMREHWRSPI